MEMGMARLFAPIVCLLLCGCGNWNKINWEVRNKVRNIQPTQISWVEFDAITCHDVDGDSLVVRDPVIIGKILHALNVAEYRDVDISNRVDYLRLCDSSGNNLAEISINYQTAAVFLGLEWMKAASAIEQDCADRLKQRVHLWNSQNTSCLTVTLANGPTVPPVPLPQGSRVQPLTVTLATKNDIDAMLGMLQRGDARLYSFSEPFCRSVRIERHSRTSTKPDFVEICLPARRLAAKQLVIDRNLAQQPDEAALLSKLDIFARTIR